MRAIITSYQAKYYANILTQRSVGGNIDCIAQSLLNAAVDINPHQVDAALFAFKSPLSKGVILADEVGLGKTIEAGLVICQYWSVGKRKIMIVCPASLRKQWSYELTDKFGVPNEILDTQNYNDYIKRGISPFNKKRVIICSYNFASRKKDEISAFGFDLSILDEAHKLRNVYKKNSKMAHNVKDALADTKKLLLTATPFQNSLMELYGLSTVIDENIFGDSRSFRAEYVNEENYSDLQLRLSAYYKRTLRKEVTEYINYTKRLPLTQNFSATDDEQALYETISEFLRRDDLYSVPKRQKMLTTMIIRKILASSTYALLGTLRTVKDRLECMLSSMQYQQVNFLSVLSEEYSDLLDDTEDEEMEESDGEQKIDPEKLKMEITEIDRFIGMAERIAHDTKADALLTALKKSFEQLSTIGANRKALIFTESTRTQQYLKTFLEANSYSGKLVLFNGSNSDKDSNAIYNDWLSENAGTGRISGIRTADKRMALVDYFKDKADIMIATEAAAEGLNLQFCSLVVNYDLPWNPQRIEQRIGRCHRYGQKYDVVVVNFVNIRNYADKRVFNLLDEKFHLFNDVFGASDEILGQADNIDFEKRIWAIYQECRSEAEINDAFEQLQKDMQEEIDQSLSDVKEKVRSNFDIEVQEHLKLSKEKTGAFLNRYEYIFWELTKYILLDKAEFDDNEHSFVLKESVADCAAHRYALFSKDSVGEPYRLSHPLAQYVINTALELPLESGKIIFSTSENAININIPEALHGKSGYLVLSTLDVSSFDEEQHSLFTAYTKDGTFLTQEECEKVFLLNAETEDGISPLPQAVADKLKVNTEQHIKSKLGEIDSRNMSYFREEEERIIRWERDLVESIEHELDTVKRQIREAERLARNAANMQEKLEYNKKVEELQRQKRKKRNELADREDEISDKRRAMIAELDERMIRQVSTEDVFTIQWEIR